MAEKPTYEELAERNKGLEKAIAQREKLQRELEKSKRFLENILNALDDPVFAKDEQHRWVVLNDKACEVMGHPRKALIGKSDYDLFPKEQADVFWEKDDEVLKTEEANINEEEITWHGKFHMISTKKSLYKDPATGRKYVVGTIRDITDLKQAQTALSWEADVNATMAELSKALIRSAPVEKISSRVLAHAKRLTGSALGYTGYIDRRTGYLVCSTMTRDVWDACQIEGKDFIFKKFVGLWGWVLKHRKSLLSNALADDPRSTGIPQGHAPIVRFIAAPALIGETLVGQVALANPDRDYCEKDLALVERLASLYAMALQREQIGEALKTSAKKYRSLVENLSDIIFTTDTDGIIRYVNPAVEAILGYESAEVMGRSFTDFIDAEDLGDALMTYQRVLAGHPQEKEYRFLSMSGEIRWLRISSHPVFDENEVTGMRGIATDITQTRRLQGQLIQSERFAATGQLAASVAHEINSPLQGITLLLTILSNTHKEDEELAKDIELMKGAFDRIRDTVKKLLDLTRPERERKQWVDVNQVIEDTVALVRGHLKKNRVHVHLNLYPALPAIIASPPQLGQVFMNLINNAVEAIKGRSQSKDGVKDRGPAGGEITIDTLLSGDDMVIRVADTGPGISNADLENIFDPFYTKKKTLGIGLSICRSIIEDHKGTIAAKNSPGHGAVFTITLPPE